MNFPANQRGVGPKGRSKAAHAGAVWLCFVIVITQASAFASVSAGDIEKAKRQRAAIQVQLDKSVAQYEAAEAKLEKTRSLMAASRYSLADSQEKMRAAQERIGKRANLTYREGSSNVFEFLFSAQTIGDFSRRIKLVGEVSRDDSTHIRELQKARTKTESIRRRLDQRVEREKQLVLELGVKSRSLEAKFGEAAVLEKKLAREQQAQLAEEQRKARAAAAAARKAKPAARLSAPVPVTPAAAAALGALPSPVLKPATSSGGIRCPVDGPTSFTDTWGQPREGGRRHEGVDMFSATGTPVVASTGGAIHRLGSGGAGGISVLLRGTNKTDYYYAHLSRLASVSVGQKVAAGTTIGYVGSTGNASAAAPHLHFEIHPGGGGAINPYPTAKAACG